MSTFQSFYRSKFPDDPRSIEQVILSVGGSPEADEIFGAFPGLEERYNTIRRRNRPSLGEEFQRGVLRGTDQLQATMFGAGKLAADLVGADGVSEAMARGVARNEAEAAENPASVSGFRDVGNVGDAIRLGIGFAGEAVPSAAESLALGLAGGVIGSAIGGPAGGVGGGATGLVGGTVARGAARALVRQGMSRGARIGTGIGLAAASVPQSIGEIYNETGNAGISLGYGAFAGALDVIPQALIAARFFKTAKVGVDEIDRARSYAKEFAAAALKTLPTTIPQEALTESAQEFINIAAAKHARGESPFSVTQDDIDRMINSGIAGASGGTLFAGPAAAGDVSARSRGIAEVRAERDAIAAEAEEQARIMQANQEAQAKVARDAQQAAQRAQEEIRRQQEAERAMEGLIGPPTPARDAFSTFDAVSIVLPSLDPMAGLSITETPDPDFDLVAMARQANLRDRLANSRLDTPVGRATSEARAAASGLSPETYQQARNAVAAATMLDRRRRQQLDAREAMIRQQLAARESQPIGRAQESAQFMSAAGSVLPSLDPLAGIRGAIDTDPDFDVVSIARENQFNELAQQEIAERRIAGSPVNADRLREELAGQEAQDASTFSQGARRAQEMLARQRAAQQLANKMAMGVRAQDGLGMVEPAGQMGSDDSGPIDPAPSIAQPPSNEQTIPRPTTPRPAQQASPATQPSAVAGRVGATPAPTSRVAVAQEEISASEASPRSITVPAVAEQARKVLAPTDGTDGRAIYVPTVLKNKQPTMLSVLNEVRPLLPVRKNDPTRFAVAVRDNTTGRVHVRSARLSSKGREPALDAMKGKRGAQLAPETGQFPATATRLDIEKDASGALRYTPIGVIEMDKGERVVAIDFDTEQQYREMKGVTSLEVAGKDRDGVAGIRVNRGVRSTSTGGKKKKTSIVSLDAGARQPRAEDGGLGVDLDASLDDPDSTPSDGLSEVESNLIDLGMEIGTNEPQKTESSGDFTQGAIDSYLAAMKSGTPQDKARADLKKLVEAFVRREYSDRMSKADIDRGVELLIQEAIRAADIKNTFRYQPEVNLLSPTRAKELLRTAIGAARDAGADVVIMERGMSDLITAFEGRGLDGRGLIGLSANHILKGNDSSLAVQALHEVAHTFIRTLSPEQQNAFHQAIDLLPTQERRWLMNPHSTDIRLIALAPESALSPVQKSILDRLTPEEVTRLRQTPPDVVLVEQAAEHLAMLGVERGLARTTMDRIIRLFKSVMHSVAMRVSRALGVPPNPAIIRAHVANQWLRFLNRDFARRNQPLHFPTEIGARPPIHDRVTYYTAPDGTSGRARLELSLETGEIMLPDFVPQDADQFGDYVAMVMRRIANNQEIDGDATIRKNPATTTITNDPVLQFTGDLAYINRVDAAYRSAFRDPEVMRLTGEIDYAKFLSKHLNLKASRQPSGLTEALRRNAEAAGVDLSAIPAETKIADLPKDADGRPSSVAEVASEKAWSALTNRISSLKGQLNTAENHYNKKVGKRDASEKSGATTSQRTKDEITRLAEEIPVRRAILRAIEAGSQSLYVDINSKPQGVYGPDTPLAKYHLTPGAQYRVPKTPQADPDKLGDWEVHTVPIGMDMTRAQSQAKNDHMRRINEWLREPDSMRYGAQYNNMQGLLKQLGKLVVNNLKYSHENLSFLSGAGGPLRQLQSIGTPAFQFIARKMGQVITNIGALRQQAERVGRENTEAYSNLRRALGYRGGDPSFHREVYNVIAHAHSMASNTPDRVGVVARALDEAKIKIDTEKKRKALRDLIYAIDAGQKLDATTFERNDLSVLDDDVGLERSLVRRGAATMRTSFSETMANAYIVIAEFDTEARNTTGADKSEYAWRDVDSAALDANLVRNDTIREDFTDPIINNEALQFFVETPSANQPVSPEMVREVWNSTADVGGIDAFAVALHNAMRSEGDPARTISSVRATFGRLYDKVRSIKSQHEQAAARADSSVLTRQIMDAQGARDFPREWLDYPTYDAGNNQLMIRQAAVNGAFGRNGEFLSPMVANAVEEIRKLHAEAQAMASAGATEKKIIQKMGEEKYRIQQRLKDIEFIAGDIKETVHAMTRTAHESLRDMRVPILFFSLIAKLTLGLSPRSSLFNPFDISGFLLKFGIGKVGIKSTGTAAKEFAGIFTNMLTGWKTVSDSVLKLKEAGLTGEDRYTSAVVAWDDYGANRILEQHEHNERFYDKAKRGAQIALRRAGSLIDISTEDVSAMMARLAGKEPAGTINENRVAKFRLISMFGNTNEAMSIAAASSYVKTYQRALVDMFSFLQNKRAAIGEERFAAYLDDLRDGTADIMDKDGYTQGMNEMDRKAHEALAADLYTYMPDGSMSRFAANAWQRTGGNIQAKNLLTDRDLAGIYTISNTEISLQANEGNAPMAFSVNPWIRSLSTFLVWPYLATMRTLRATRDPSSRKITLPSIGEQGFEAGSAARFMATMMLGVLPATMAASLLMDVYDEEVMGKKSNSRPMDKLAAVPGLGLWAIKDDWQGALERFARFSPTGFVGEIVNELLGQDDARNGGLSIDTRVFSIAYMRNWVDLVSRMTNSDMQATYGSFYRPILMQLGARGSLEVTQVLSNAIGADTPEARYNERINVGNIIRGAGRTMGLEARRGIELRGGATTPVTPWLAQMELAAIANDRTDFRDAYRRAVQKALEGGRAFDEAESYVKSSFARRHPLRRVFATDPSEVEYRKLLGLLDDRATDAVTSAIRNYNKYIEALGGQAFYGRKSSSTSMARANAEKRPMSIIEAQALAARSAYGVDL